MTAEHEALPEDIVQAAIGWYVALAAGAPSPAQQARFEQWREADPRHQRAWQRLQKMSGPWQTTRAYASASQARQALAQAGNALRERRRALRLLALGAGGGLLGYGVSRNRDWPGAAGRLLADAHTGIGERRAVTLQDGTRLLLDSATAIDTRFTPQARHIVLRQGRIRVHPAADAALRPLRVVTDDGDIAAGEGVLHVRLLPGEPWAPRAQTLVSVSEGTARLRPRGLADAPPAPLAAGQQTRMRPDGLEPARPLDPAGLAWEDGLFQAAGMPLVLLAAELSCYRPGVVRCDPAVASLRITGNWPLSGPGATDRILASVARYLPVRIVTRTRYWVAIQPV